MSPDAFPIRKLAPQEFPPLLAEIPDPPKQLYARGTLVPKENKILAVVGSREYSPYGRQSAETLIKGLAGYPISIISGLARGMDSIAHQSALDTKLHTIAVPGSGIADSSIYPRRNLALAHEILASGGGLLSELEPSFPATAWAFPQRNRVMAGMSHAILIVEAGERSGTLITARLGMEYNRDILTVPGSIFSSTSWGPHALIRDGATPITRSEDILEALNLKERQGATPSLFTGSPEERALLALLDAPLLKDELLRASGRPAQETNTLITILELNGYIREDNGRIIRTVEL